MPFLLPESPATEYICVNLEIPNTQQDIRNFLGSLLSLAQWFNYERTGNDLGKQVADTWLVALNNCLIGGCMQVRQNSTSPCLLEYSTDDGQTWLEFADITLCVDPAYIQSLINNNTALQQTIATYSNISNISSNTPQQTSILQSDLLQNQGCNSDNIFGMTTGLTDFLNQVSEDILEILVNAPAALGRLGDLISAIPVVETLPFDEALQFAEKLATQVNDAYQAGYTTQIRDTFRCDLFCLAQPNCELTIEMARDYFANELTVSVSNTDFLTIVNDVIANNWLGTQSIYLLHWIILDTIIFGGEVLGIDHNKIMYQVGALFNDPDSDWTALCQNCTSPFTWNSDFTNSQNIWSPMVDSWGNNASWTSGIGWQSVDKQVNTVPSYVRQIQIATAEFSPCTITDVTMNYDLTKGTYDNSGLSIVTLQLEYVNGSFETIYLDPITASNGSNLTYSLTGTYTSVKSIRVWLRASQKNNTATYSGSVALNSLQVSGLGVNPFI